MGNDFVDDLTAEEQKKANRKLKQDAHDELIKTVFDNLRNMSICIGLVIAGGAVMKYRDQLNYSEITNMIFGVFIIIITMGLFAWNTLHGIDKLTRSVQGTRKALKAAPLMLIYIFLAFAIFQAMTLLNIDKQLHELHSLSTTTFPAASFARC